MKFMRDSYDNPFSAKQIQNAQGPMAALNLARSHTQSWTQQDWHTWDSVKVQYMFEIVYNKFRKDMICYKIYVEPKTKF